MAVPITTAQAIAWTDKIAALWTIVETMASGVATKSTDLDTQVAGYSDYDLRSSLAGPTHSVGAGLTLTTVTKASHQKALLGFTQAIRAAGVLLAVTSIQSIDSFASYYNYGAGGTVQCLLHPVFAALWLTVYGTAPLSPKNIFSPAVATMATWVQGTGLTAGTAVNTALYGGCPNLSAVVTGWSGAGGTCSFAVSGLNAAGTVVTDTWTVSISANGTFTPTGTVVKLVQSCTNITPTSMTAGTIVVSGGLPAGRANPPT